MAEREPPPPPTKAGDEPLPSTAAAQNTNDPHVAVIAATNAVTNMNISDNAAAPREYSFNFNIEGGGDNSDEDSEDAGYEEDFLMDSSSLPKCLRQRIKYLKQLHSQREDIIKGYVAERAALEAKYAKLCQPLYATRKKVIRGEMEDEEIASQLSNEAKQAGPEEETPEGAEEQPQVKGIPQFWVCAMGHMDGIAEIISEADVDCLEHCYDITCEDHADGLGFTLKFFFEPNEYFTNDVLTKRYEIPNLLLADEPVLKDVAGCDINWKAGKCLTYKEVKKTQRAKGGKRAGQIRTAMKKERVDSFFHFFSPPKLPSMEDMDEEHADALEDAFDHDYDIAQAFRSHVIPEAVLWFTGEGMLDVDEDGDDNENDETDRDDEDSENDEQEGGPAATAAADWVYA